MKDNKEKNKALKKEEKVSPGKKMESFPWMVKWQNKIKKDIENPIDLRETILQHG